MAGNFDGGPYLSGAPWAEVVELQHAGRVELMHKRLGRSRRSGGLVCDSIINDRVGEMLVRVEILENIVDLPGPSLVPGIGVSPPE